MIMFISLYIITILCYTCLYCYSNIMQKMHITLLITYPRNELYDYVSIMHIICMYIITIIHVECGDIIKWYIRWTSSSNLISTHSAKENGCHPFFSVSSP